MREPWRDTDLPIEHRRAHAGEAEQAGVALQQSVPWSMLADWIGDLIEERRDLLEQTAKDPAESDDFHRGYLAACRVIVGRPEAAEHAGRKFINKEHGA